MNVCGAVQYIDIDKTAADIMCAVARYNHISSKADRGDIFIRAAAGQMCAISRILLEKKWMWRDIRPSTWPILGIRSLHLTHPKCTHTVNTLEAVGRHLWLNAAANESRILWVSSGPRIEESFESDRDHGARIIWVSSGPRSANHLSQFWTAERESFEWVRDRGARIANHLS